MPPRGCIIACRSLHEIVCAPSRQHAGRETDRSEKSLQWLLGWDGMIASVKFHTSHCRGTKHSFSCIHSRPAPPLETHSLYTCCGSCAVQLILNYLRAQFQQTVHLKYLNRDLMLSWAQEMPRRRPFGWLTIETSDGHLRQARSRGMAAEINKGKRNRFRNRFGFTFNKKWMEKKKKKISKVIVIQTICS